MGMRVTFFVWIIVVLLLPVGCGSTAPSMKAPAEPVIRAPIINTSATSAEMMRGPWDTARLAAAEKILKTPLRDELDRQRHALAAAYIYWGEPLLTQFPTDKPSTPTGETLPSASVEGPNRESVERPMDPSASSPLPPVWYWNEKPQQQLDRMLQQQREQYYRDRQQPPAFPRPPICNSYVAGGQVYTQCH
jgi:hypothetical protein